MYKENICQTDRKVERMCNDSSLVESFIQRVMEIKILCNSIVTFETDKQLFRDSLIKGNALDKISCR